MIEGNEIQEKVKANCAKSVSYGDALGDMRIRPMTSYGGGGAMGIPPMQQWIEYADTAATIQAIPPERYRYRDELEYLRRQNQALAGELRSARNEFDRELRRMEAEQPRVEMRPAETSRWVAVQRVGPEPEPWYKKFFLK